MEDIRPLGTDPGAIPVEAGRGGRIGRRTRVSHQRPRGEEQEVDRLLPERNVPANVVHGADQADVRADEDVLAVRVQRRALGDDALR